jgi:hypothetical protein
VLSSEDLEQSPLYSEALGIDLASLREEAVFAWFLASQLYGGRIAESIAERTYGIFAAEGLLSPAAIIAAGREHLINPVMRRGGYVRYDNRKIDQILRACHTIADAYGGRVGALHEAAADAADLETRLKAIYGIGPVTANIFLRELRPFWEKADPAPLPVIAGLAQVVGIDVGGYERKSLRFARVEAGLLRHRRQLEWRIDTPRGSART